MNIDFLNALRIAEIEQVIAWYGELFAGRRVLEIGSGTGIQLDRLSGIAEEVCGLDLEGGIYSGDADPRVRTYDGHHIPFPDGHFDVVFSSNVLEHVRHREAFQAEIARVLAPGGRCVHILPTHHWRAWTTLATIALAPVNLAIAAAASVRDGEWRLPRSGGEWRDLLIGEQHGEFGSRRTEYDHFRPGTWAEVFRRCGWRIDEMRPLGMFYEGNTILGPLLPIERRKALARIFGSACALFVLDRYDGAPA